MAEDEIWDEDKWEAFLRERDKRLEQYMSLLFTFIRVYPLPEQGATAQQKNTWMRQLRDYLMNKGVIPDEYMLSFLFSDEDEQAGEGSWETPDHEYLEADPEQDVAEAWFQIPGFEEAKQLASKVLDWVTDLPISMKDSTLVQFCTHIQQIPANLVKGHSLGYDKETLGGNIACVKRSLSAANGALRLMQEMKSASYMTETMYQDLYERTFELRNNIGIYVQELRRRFDLGLD